MARKLLALSEVPCCRVFVCVIDMKRKVKAVRLVRIKRVEPEFCYGYPIKSLVCLAEVLRLKGIRYEQLEEFMLNLDFVWDAVWKAKWEIIKKAENDIVMREIPDMSWVQDWNDRHKSKNFSATFDFINIEKMKKENEE